MRLEPANPALAAARWPFYMLFLALRWVLVFFASCCFSLGDGIAEARPPRPVGFAPMDLPADDGLSFEMAARRPMGDDDGCGASLLRDDAAPDAYEFEEDDGDENPFARRQKLK